MSVSHEVTPFTKTRKYGYYECLLSDLGNINKIVSSSQTHFYCPKCLHTYLTDFPKLCSILVHGPTTIMPKFDKLFRQCRLSPCVLYPISSVSFVGMHKVSPCWYFPSLVTKYGAVQLKSPENCNRGPTLQRAKNKKIFFKLGRGRHRQRKEGTLKKGKVLPVSIFVVEHWSKTLWVNCFDNLKKLYFELWHF